MSSAHVERFPGILGVLLMILGVRSSKFKFTLSTFVKLARELMLDTSDRLSGLARGARPNQSSWMRSTLGLETRDALLEGARDLWIFFAEL